MSNEVNTIYLMRKIISMVSFQVPLGILLFNENKGKDMIQILSCLHKYVPTIEESNEEIYVPSRRELASMPREILHKTLFGGDQLTVARMRGAQAAKTNSITPTGRMEGFEPVIEDWHTKVVLIEVSYRFYQVYIKCILESYVGNLEI